MVTAEGLQNSTTGARVRFFLSFFTSPPVAGTVQECLGERDGTLVSNTLVVNDCRAPPFPPFSFVPPPPPTSMTTRQGQHIHKHRPGSCRSPRMRRELSLLSPASVKDTTPGSPAPDTAVCRSTTGPLPQLPFAFFFFFSSPPLFLPPKPKTDPHPAWVF